MELLSQLSLPELLALQWLNGVVRYIVIAGLTYLVFWKLLYEKLRPKFLYKQLPGKKDLAREIKYSVLTTFIFMLPALSNYVLRKYGLSKLYFDVGDYPTWWYVASFGIVLLAHDTYFYWTHRLMH